MTLAELAAVGARLVGAVSPAEAAGAALGVVYIVLAIRQHRACWLAAFASTALYLYVFHAAGLLMQSLLQAYYLAVAVYGWWAWRGGRGDATGLAVSRAPWAAQLVAAVLIALASLLTAQLLARETGAADPWLDSLTTWGSVYATWLVARKKIDNWPWWLAVDSLIVLLCWRQRLFASMILYVLYLGLVVVGWRSWQRDLMTRAGGRA